MVKVYKRGRGLQPSDRKKVILYLWLQLELAGQAIIYIDNQGLANVSTNANKKCGATTKAQGPGGGIL